MSDPYLSGEKYCEVYDEPRHQFHLRNEFTNIYEIELPPGNVTQYHRHSEDTVYFVIADADIEQSFLDQPTIQMVASCGGTLSREHHQEPLIHQVRNVGAGTMHMVGAEALARAPTSAPISARNHELLWESDRFRVYDVDSQIARDTCDTYGLLVSFDATTLNIAGGQNAGTATFKLSAGGFVWMEPSVTIDFGATFRGIFAQWK